MHIGARLGLISGGKPDRQKVYVGYQATNSSSTTYTFTSFGFGGVAPSPTRIVVAAISTRLNAPVSSVTIDGISATLYANTSGGGNVDKVCFAVATVPTGTGTYSVVVNTSGTFAGMSCAIYCFDGLDSNTPYRSGGAAASTITISTVPSTSYVVVNQNCRSEVGTFSGTLGLTKDGGIKYFSDRSSAWGSVDSAGGSNLTATYSYAFTSYEAINYIIFK